MLSLDVIIYCRGLDEYCQFAIVVLAWHASLRFSIVPQRGQRTDGMSDFWACWAIVMATREGCPTVFQMFRAVLYIALMIVL